MKRGYYLYTIIIILFFVSFVFFSKEKEKVVFLDVGQGDASLIFTKERTVLIDGGPDLQVLSSLGESLGYHMKIDDIIISHAHSDHFLGLAEIVERYEVDNLYYYKSSLESDTYLEFINKVKRLDIRIRLSKRGDKIRIRNDCYLYFLWPILGNNNDFNVNELSLVNYFACGKLKVLFTGDISEAVEKQLITLDNDLKFDVLKSAHHGSKYSNSEEFLKYFKVKEMVVSSGKGNKYGFPAPELMSRAKNLEIEVVDLSETGSHELLIEK